MRYRTPEALSMAVAAAARESGMDVSRAVTGFYFHRLLCRVFSDPGSPFLLKGGQSMLARTPSARTTRDIDLLSCEGDLATALAELKELVSIDLDDHLVFEFVSADPIKANDEYRSGLKVVFQPMLGSRRLHPVSIDMVVDQIPCGEPEVLAPADRIDVEGVPVFDYRLYPIANSVADKLCGIIELHDGRPSSRVKDLVDLVVYATSEDVRGDALCRRCALEAGARGIVLPSHFAVPESWWARYQRNFERLVRGTSLDESFADMGKSEALVASMLDLVFSGDALGRTWSCATLGWVDALREGRELPPRPDLFSG